MDPTRFDGIAIAVGRRATRRVILTALTRATAGATLAALLTVPGREEAAAGQCLKVFDVCTSTKQCCGHKRGRRICAANPQINDQETTCCIPEGKRCSFGGQCCGNGFCNSATGRCDKV
jgi:hypothetical protein